MSEPIKDWQGKDVTELEPPEKIIEVWQIAPHPDDSTYDLCLVRGYQDALAAAKRALENVVDQANPETLRSTEGITVTMKVVKMRKDEYEAEIAEP